MNGISRQKRLSVSFGILQQDLQVWKRKRPLNYTNVHTGRVIKKTPFFFQTFYKENTIISLTQKG